MSALPLRGNQRFERDSFVGTYRRQNRRRQGASVGNESGAPVRWLVLVASQSDIYGFRQMILELPAGLLLSGEAAYWNDWHEVELAVARRKNAREPLEASPKKLWRAVRGRVGTSFSLFIDRWQRRPRATFGKGFCLFLNSALLALAFDVRIHHRNSLQKLWRKKRGGNLCLYSFTAISPREIQD